MTAGQEHEENFVEDAEMERDKVLEQTRRVWS